MKFEQLPNRPNSVLKFENCFFSFNGEDINLDHKPELAIILSPFWRIGWTRGKCIIKYWDFRNLLEANENEIDAIECFLKQPLRYWFWTEWWDKEIIEFINKLKQNGNQKES